jgi:hypothetical protein
MYSNIRPRHRRSGTVDHNSCAYSLSVSVSSTTRQDLDRYERVVCMGNVDLEMLGERIRPRVQGPRSKGRLRRGGMLEQGLAGLDPS